MTELTTEERQEISGFAKLWWLWLVVGIVWLLVALVILQFDTASVKTVGVIIGVMFLFVGVQEFVMSTLVEGWRWVWIVFGVLFVLAGLWALFNPAETVATIADSLGFLFLLVAIFWVVEAFATKGSNDLWWLGLLAGILMFVIAFWTAGQFLIERVYILLVFAGAWALMQGVIDIIRAFEIRRVGKYMAG